MNDIKKRVAREIGSHPVFPVKFLLKSEELNELELRRLEEPNEELLLDDDEGMIGGIIF